MQSASMNLWSLKKLTKKITTIFMDEEAITSVPRGGIIKRDQK